LRQLQTDWIDVYQLHNVSNADALKQVLAPQGAYEAVSKARDAGKIRFIGISSHSIATAMEALKTGLFQTLQFPFNFIEIDPADQLFPFATQNNVGIIGMKPLGEESWNGPTFVSGFCRHIRMWCRFPEFGKKRGR